MSLLKVADFVYINPDRITFVEAKRSKVYIQFHNELSVGGIGVPKSYVVLEGNEAKDFVRWLESNTDKLS